MSILDLRFKITVFSFVTLITIFGFHSSFSQSKVDQLSNSQVLQFYQQAKASGLSDMQIEQAAMAQGFTLTDIAKMRQRITQVQGGDQDTDTNADSLVMPRKQMGAKLSKKRQPQKDTIDPKKPVLFGSNLFSTENLTFEPNLRIATPKNYQLGPDDEVLVDISGNAAGNYKLKVSPEGFVKIKDIAPIKVSGMTIEAANEKIIGRLRQMYSGLNAGGGTYAYITLGNIRSIKVTVTGEAVKPGTYTISSLATAFNALYVCGGPTDNGSYRNIQVIRNNKVTRTIDLYDFLLRADQANNVLLEDQDIINIPFYDIQVGVRGETKRGLAIYELKQGETLKDILKFAGGFTDKAYKASITVLRNTDREQKIESVNQDKYDNFIGQSGDRYTVNKILSRFENRVLVMGAINQAGAYALDNEVNTIKKLIVRADGLREDAFKNRAVLYREKENREYEIIGIDLNKILSGEAEDIALQRQDSLVIKSIKELRERYFITVLGEVNKTGDIEYAENMTVSDVVALSGGFTDGAISSRMEIARRIKDINGKNLKEDATIQIIPFKIDRQLGLNPNDAEFKLQPYDIVFIRKSPLYDVQKSAIVAGEVNYPGSYAIVNNIEKLSSLIERAGGIKKGGYLPGAVLRRNGERVAIDIAEILKNPDAQGNIHVEDKDSLFIPEERETVRITGAVLNPTVVNYNSQFDFQKYLSQSGGFGKEALKKSVYVTYANGYTERTKRFFFFKKYPKIEPGATIFIPYKPQDITKSDITGPALLSFTGTLITAMILIFRR